MQLHLKNQYSVVLLSERVTGDALVATCLGLTNKVTSQDHSPVINSTRGNPNVGFSHWPGGGDRDYLILRPGLGTRQGLGLNLGLQRLRTRYTEARSSRDAPEGLGGGGAPDTRREPAEEGGLTLQHEARAQMPAQAQARAGGRSPEEAEGSGAGREHPTWLWAGEAASGSSYQQQKEREREKG